MTTMKREGANESNGGDGESWAPLQTHSTQLSEVGTGLGQGENGLRKWSVFHCSYSYCIKQKFDPKIIIKGFTQNCFSSI